MKIMQGVKEEKVAISFSSRSEVNKSVWPSRAEGPSVARAARIRAKNIFKTIYIYIYIYIYIDEGVRSVAWQQCKHSLFDVRERESCQAATGCETGNL